MNRRGFLSRVLAPTVAVTCWRPVRTPAANLHTNASALIQRQPNRLTVLMGDAASLRGNLVAIPPEHGAKHFQVSGWSQVTDGFTWRIGVPSDGLYVVNALIRGFGANIEFQTPQRVLSASINTEWFLCGHVLAGYSANCSRKPKRSRAAARPLSVGVL